MNKRSYKKYIDRSQAMVVLLELERSVNVLALALTEDNDILVQETLANLKSRVANLRDMLEERPLAVPTHSCLDGCQFCATIRPLTYPNSHPRMTAFAAQSEAHRRGGRTCMGCKGSKVSPTGGTQQILSLGQRKTPGNGVFLFPFGWTPAANLASLGRKRPCDASVLSPSREELKNCPYFRDFRSNTQSSQ